MRRHLTCEVLGMKQKVQFWFQELTCIAPAHRDLPLLPASGWWRTHCYSPCLPAQPKACISSLSLPVSSAAWHILAEEASNASPTWPPPLQGKQRMFTWQLQGKAHWPLSSHMVYYFYIIWEKQMTVCWQDGSANKGTYCQVWGPELNS